MESHHSDKCTSSLSDSFDTIPLVFSRILLFFIVLLFPSQFGIHFWPKFAYLSGFRLDYLAPALYLSEVLILLYLLLNLKTLLIVFRTQYRLLLLFLLAVAINCLFTSYIQLVIYSWSKFCLYLSFVLVLRQNKTTLTSLLTPLYLSCLWTVFLALLQFSHQSSAGGLWYYLGERSFSLSTSNLAKNIYFGQLVLRPYASFSHPNSMAGYLLIVLYLLRHNKSSSFKQLILLVGILLTQSKAALLSLPFIILPLKSTKILTLWMSSLLLISFVIDSSLNLPVFIRDRLFYLAPSLSLLSTSGVVGTGYGAYIPALSKILPASFQLPGTLQPIHQTLILILTEIGIIPLLIIAFIIKKIKVKNKTALIGLLGVAVMGLSFDHYWWTLLQNKLLLLLVTALMV